MAAALYLVTPALLLLCRPLAPAGAQRPDTVAERYEPVLDELRKMEPRGDRVASIRNVTLRRDVIEFHLEDGQLFIATPVAGRAVAAIFVGRGSVSFAPPIGIERRELKRVLGDSVVNSRISTVAFVFTDSTLVELERQLTFGGGGVTTRASGVLHDALDRLVDGHIVVQPTLMTALLNGDSDGFFYAHVKREDGEDLMFMVDPADEEPVTLLRGGREGQKVQVVSEFRRAENVNDTTAVEPGRGDPLRLDAYRIEATIAKGLGFSAGVTVRLTARRAVRWARFDLLAELDVDSVREGGGRAVAFWRPGKTSELWVRFDPAARPGDTLALRVAYHGDLIGYTSIVQDVTRTWPGRIKMRVPLTPDQWLYIKTSYYWFPRYGRQSADVDLTFHSPKRYRLASIGKLVDTHLEGDVVTSHWATERPADQVCFSLGDVDEFKITDPRIPPVTVHTNGEAHRRLDRFFLALRDEFGAPDLWVNRFLSQRSPEQEVGADVANSLAFFTRVYGPPLFDRYYAAEIPFPYGQAFPGLMYLPVWTFQAMSDSGYDEILRAHEMAHQWWGIGVEPAGYRDWWLSEGFAEFSGLWYMQLVLGDNPKFFRHLKHWRKEIRARRNGAPPIAIGTRSAQLNARDATLTTYHKGSWVLHMLRNLMLNLRTMQEDTFIAMMRDFYGQYRGRRASTRDFQRVVERHLKTDMNWFFDEWVRGTAIPTYVLSWHAEPAEPGQAGHYALRVRVRQEDVPTDFTMPVPLKITFTDTTMHALVRLGVTGPLTEVTLDLPAEPKRLELNPLESVLADVREESWDEGL